MSERVEVAVPGGSVEATAGHNGELVPVIQYHMIDRPSSQSRIRGGFTPPGRFARQMAYLKSHGFKFYTAGELIEYYLGHRFFPPSGIAITFDDGCRDNYTNAFPVLRQLGIKATMFVVPSCVGKISAMPLAEGEAPRPHVSRDEIVEMSQFGIEFGSHTMNHRMVHQISTEDIRYEVSSAKDYLEDLLRMPCKTFAYPAGYYTPEAEQIIQAAGHICAFSTVHGPKDRIDLFAINRIEILRRDWFSFQFGRKVKPLKSYST